MFIKPHFAPIDAPPKETIQLSDRALESMTFVNFISNGTTANGFISKIMAMSSPT
jgi:hypothetical protein